MEPADALEATAVSADVNASADVNGDVIDELDIQPSPAFVKQPDVITSASPKLTPKSSPKMSTTVPVPSNPLEAAMFKQLFPEQPKVVVKKSLAEMKAESGNKASGVSPAMARRDSRTDNETGLLYLPCYWLGEQLSDLTLD